MIDLFEHNKTAYDSAVSMLAETGKAAIVHPTGTGKSFIGFKLCEDNPEKIVCWLSPSEYIFKTQLENLAKVSGGWQPENVRFCTYAKLMLLTEAELAEIAPDYIVLDEFHRCGAEQWGKGVAALLEMYSGVPILGLSATNIRYLDNQRDMADELFDGNVASEMTLGEAIVRGILAAPKYVLSVFSYQQQLEKYEQRIRRTKNKAVRDPAERYLDALRRALEKADGLDVIFDKHMADRTGKYIVFCANFEHMREMIGKATAWFSKVDPKPHIYTVYSDDPSASKSFQDFKADEDTKHLKLLYCIDALNEGVHVDDVSGVILLRPTVSPIIYKQQIGRALAAGKKDNPVIFDIVLNIENLYSIGAIEEEMQVAMTYYRSLGENEAIVNETFRVIDEVRDCRRLFDRLENALVASWDIMYGYAKEYYEQKGNLEIPARYKTEDGYALGRWLFNQKGIRKWQIEGKLTEEQIAKLDAIGMIWGYYNDLNWERNYAAAKAYFVQHGNLDVHSRYVTDDGIALGLWLCSIRTWERAGVHPKYLTVERKAELEKIGMIWDKLDFFWERNYLAACEYYREHRNLRVNSNYVDKNGIRLGSWIARIRGLRSGKGRGTPPTEEQIARLDKIGMIWDGATEYKWEIGFDAAEKYVRQNGNLAVPIGYVTQDGYKLFNWLARQKLLYRNGSLDPIRKQRLDGIGMIWPGDTWEDRFEAVKKYYAETGSINISQKVIVDGCWIGKWLRKQKQAMEEGKLDDKQVAMLRTLPIEHVGDRVDSWYSIYQDAVTFKSEHGSLFAIPKLYVGASGYRLSNWVFNQRRLYSLGKLSKEKVNLLNEIGFNWENETAWERGFRHAKSYYGEHGDLLMRSNYKTSDGYTLGIWIYKCRRLYMEDKLTQKQVAALDKIGMVWQLESEKNSSRNENNKLATVKKIKKHPSKVKQPPNPWDVSFAAALKIYREFGSVIDIKPVNSDEKKLYHWLRNQRHSYRAGYLTESQIKLLSSIGITAEWLGPQPTPFEKGYAIAKEYYETHGDLNIKSNYQHTNGFWLGAWMDKIRKKKSELTAEQLEMLSAIGVVWDVTDNWEKKYTEAKYYFDKHGQLPLEPKQCETREETLLCQWLRRQLLRRNDGKMPQEQINRLSAIGMDWMNSVERGWYRGYSHAKEYRDVYGDLNVIVTYVAPDGYPLGEWLHSQRTHRKRLSDERRQMLCEIGAKGMETEGDKFE